MINYNIFVIISFASAPYIDSMQSESAESDSSGFGMEDNDGSDAESEGNDRGDSEAENTVGDINEGSGSDREEGDGQRSMHCHNDNRGNTASERDDESGSDNNEEEMGEEDDNTRANASRESRNCNNLGKSLVQVCMTDFMELKESDGMPFFFMSESMGPAVSPMAMQQILGLLHLFNHPLEAEHIMSTAGFDVVWDKTKVKRAMVMEKLRMKVTDWKDPDDIDMEDFSRIQDYPTDFHRDFTNRNTGSVNKVVPFAEILLSPVVAHYTDSSTGRACCKTFWVVIVKTRRVYNFTQHLCDFLRSPDKGLRDYQRGKDWQEIYQLWKVI